ncbi:MAG: acylphosphatase [Ruminococcus sp.]|nr:acylphosphatase [Ruminococcus sp.]
MQSERNIRRHFRLYGRVQGVGFRYRAYYAARSYGVTGYVRNLSDGSVEMEMQAPEECIDKTFLAIEKGTFIRIDNIEVKDIPVNDDEREFRVCE